MLRPRGKLATLIKKAFKAAGYDRGSILLVGIEGDDTHVRTSLLRTTGLFLKHRGVPLGTGPGTRWYEQRFAMPYLRDPLLDRGIGVDTLETSTCWSNLLPLYDATLRAIRTSLPRCIVLTHISHAYRDGASLYFTFLFPRDEHDEVEQWRRVKHAASQAISNHGGTISHHHGVGKDHLPWMKDEKGNVGINLLAALKKEVDPHNILNPGKLIPHCGE